jgi:hypothetical protein
MKFRPFAFGLVLGVACIGFGLSLTGRAGVLAVETFASAQETSRTPEAADPPAAADVPQATTPPSAVEPADRVESVNEEVEGALAEAEERVDAVAEQVDANETAKQVTAGILQPIYALAERMAFSWFYWLAFAAMATGVVSYALQLVLGKLVALTRMSFSPTEILSDALGFVISVVGLVLTTQAAAENSTFTGSSFAVLSASLVGVLAGIVFYLWGQSQELAAAKGRWVSRAEERVVRKDG